MTNYKELMKARIDKLKNNDRPVLVKKEVEKAKFPFFKPELGQNLSKNTYEVRFLPYKDVNDQPSEEVLYYNNFQERRIIAPIQYGLPDKLHDYLNEIYKERKNKEVWKRWSALKAKPRFYTVIIVRGPQEAKGPQVWEMSDSLYAQFYDVMSHEDYENDNMLDPIKGYDFTLSVEVKPGKSFKGQPVKDLKLIGRRKPSPLSKDEKQVEKWLSEIPNLREYFMRFVPDEERQQNILDNYHAELEGVVEADNLPDNNGVSQEDVDALDKVFAEF